MPVLTVLPAPTVSAPPEVTVSDPPATVVPSVVLMPLAKVMAPFGAASVTVPLTILLARQAQINCRFRS